MELDISKTYYLCNYLGAGSAEVLSGGDLMANIASGDWGEEKDWTHPETAEEVTIRDLFNHLEETNLEIGKRFMSDCGTAIVSRIF
jgi:hypothetical protein